MKKADLPRLGIWLIPALLSIVALAKLPYGYYQFLRIVICVASCYLVYNEYQLKDGINTWVIIFVLLAILFNPVIPVHLTREIWKFINVLCACLFMLHFFMKFKTK